MAKAGLRWRSGFNEQSCKAERHKFFNGEAPGKVLAFLGFRHMDAALGNSADWAYEAAKPLFRGVHSRASLSG